MNKYVVPIFDNEIWNTWIESIEANSIEECENLLMEILCDIYDELPRDVHYTDFLNILDSYNICIGEIHNINEI